jgi:hypothetical protein
MEKIIGRRKKQHKIEMITIKNASKGHVEKR